MCLYINKIQKPKMHPVTYKVTEPQTGWNKRFVR